MGGTSTQQQNQNQTQSQTQNTSGTSTSNPWDAANPMLQGILAQLRGGLNNTGVTGAENGALNRLSANGANPFAGQISANAGSLLSGGGAMGQAGALDQNYQRYVDQANPIASNMNYDPMQNPGTAGLIDTIRNDVGNSVNSQFAAAGRDLSGANQQAYGRGVSQGVAPVLFDQYNQNRNAQQAAAGNLYSAGNLHSGLLSGLNQQDLANRQAGVQASQDAIGARNAGDQSILAAEAARRNIPVQALGLLAQIGIPIAGLGGTTSSTGTGTSNGTMTGVSSGRNTMSGAEQFGRIAQGVGGLFGGSNSAAGNIFGGAGRALSFFGR